ncbi:hypothetical protein VTO73DRAFT_14054 [Trametes versicolor]
MAHGTFAKLKEGMLRYPSEPMRGASDWRNVPVRHLWGNRSTWEMPWAAKLLDEELEQAKNAGKRVRDIVLVRFKGANHFFLQKARACCLAVVSRIIGHSPLSQPTPEDAVDDSCKLRQDLDTDIQYPLAFPESSRPALPLGTTVATFLGLSICGRLSPGHFRYHLFPPRLPFPITVISGLAAASTQSKTFRSRSSRSSRSQTSADPTQLDIDGILSGLHLVQRGVEAILQIVAPPDVDVSVPSSGEADGPHETWLEPIPQGAHLFPPPGNMSSGEDPVIPQAHQSSSEGHPAIRSWRAHVEKPSHSDGDDDGNDILDPNRNAQRAQALGASGGSRRFVRPRRGHTVELPSAPLSIDVGGYPVWTQKHPWQTDSLTYAGPHSTQPVLSHHGYAFNVVAEIAEGSAGRVVAVERKGCLYAVKAMHKWHAHKVCGYRRSALIEEKDVMARITEARMPSFATLLMSWEDQHSVYFVMPFYSMDMDARLRLPMSEHDRLLYCTELIIGLEHLHQLNIVHRDIKPANILIDGRGRAVISDFGLSTTIAPGEYDTWRGYELAGTVPYMAPEMVGVRRKLDGYGAGVDVFSMGVVFLQLFGLGDCWDFSPELRWDHLALIHPVWLPIEPRLLAGLGTMAASLLPLMLEMSPIERIHVDNLWDYVPEDLYTEVCAEAQTHDWTPGSWSTSEKPVGRCLEFLTFQKESAHDVETSSSVRRFRRDEEGAQPMDLEYRAPKFLEA